MDKNIKAPAITVLMATYNAANYISESIQSILNQTFGDFELLIVNDGSTDNTIEIVNEFTDPRIRLVHNDKNRGLTYTRNVAMKEARGKYIAILDSDDIAMPDRLKIQYNFFRAHPEVALCGGHGLVINKQGNVIANETLIVPTGNDMLKMTLLFMNTYVNSTVMYKTSVLKELNGYLDYAPAEDYELFVRIAEKYPIANLNESLVKYRMHENNTSLLKIETAKLKIREIKKNQLSYLGIYDERMADTLFSLLMWNYSAYKFTDYLSLFTQLKIANRELKKHPVKPFEKMLFEKWFQVIYIKKAKMNALPLLFHKNLFKWSHLNARQFRKTLRLTLKGIGKISK